MGPEQPQPKSRFRPVAGDSLELTLQADGWNVVRAPQKFEIKIN